MKKIILLISFLCISIISYPLNFSVAPTRFSVDIEKISTNEIYILNNTSNPMRLEAYLENDKVFGENFGLKEQIVIFPKKISIKPGATQTIRFRVKANSNLPDGELKSYIIFKELPSEIKMQNKSDSIKDVSTTVAILTEIGIPVYAHKGTQKVDGFLKNISIKRNKNIILLKGISESMGNTSIKFSYEIDSLKLKDKLIGEWGISARSGKKEISNGISLPKNLKNEKIKLIIKDQNEKVYYKTEI